MLLTVEIFYVTVLLACNIRSALSIIEFKVQPESSPVLLGSSHTFSCVAVDTVSAERASIVWRFENLPIDKNSFRRAFFFANDSMNIVNIQESDLGNYTCLAKLGDDVLVSEPAALALAYIEPFVISPVPQLVLENTPVSLLCVSGKSYPSAEVYWMFDNERLLSHVLEQIVGVFGNPADGQKSLLLQFIMTPLHVGMYQCIANNLLTGTSEHSAEAEVNITYGNIAPRIELAPPKKVLYAPVGSTFVLECVISGRPQPDIKWIKDGKLLPTVLEDMYQLENGWLYFGNVKNDDEGMYVCQGSNAEGVVRTKPTRIIAAFLDFNFLEQPQNKSTIAGNPVVMNCRAPHSFPAAAHVLWYKDNIPVKNKTGLFAAQTYLSGDLHLSKVQKSDEGKYVCVAVNEYAVPQSRSSHDAYLTVKAAPLLTEPPFGVVLVKGEMLQLRCMVTGDPVPTIQWFRNNVPVPLNHRITYGKRKQELFIAKVGHMDEGHYHCRANNSLGTVNSPTAFVSILIPPYFVRYLSDQYIAAGNIANFSCLAFGNPMPRISWLFNNTQVISSSLRMHLSENGLRVSDVSLKDQGLYTCKAENEAGMKEQSAYLYIQVAPKVMISPAYAAVAVGEPVSLYCSVTGVPEPKLYWAYKKNSSSIVEPIPDGILVNDATLSIESTQLEYTGIYYCIGENIIKRSNASVVINVLVAPVITNVTDSAMLRYSDEFTLVCVATGIPSPSVMWLQGEKRVVRDRDARITVSSFPEEDDKLALGRAKYRKDVMDVFSSHSLHNSSRAVVKISFVRLEDAGTYVCRAINAARTQEKLVNIQVKEVPVPPVLQSAYPISSTEVKLTWFKKPANNYAMYYTVQYRDRSSDTYMNFVNVPTDVTHVKVDGLHPDTQYLFRIIAGDELGPGQVSNILVAKTYQAAASAPRNLQLHSISARSANITWEIPLFASSDRPVDFYRILVRKTGDAVFTGQQLPATHDPTVFHTLGNLYPYTAYEAKVQAALTENGYQLWGNATDILTIQTLIAAPSEAPANISANALSSKVVHVQWQDIPTINKNGPLLGYVVKYGLASESLSSTPSEAITDQLQINITGLHPWQHYSISIQGYNTEGRGPESIPVIVRTYPERPSGPPRLVRAGAVNSTTVKVIWNPINPLERNSEIHGYVVEFRKQGDKDGGQMYLQTNIQKQSAGNSFDFTAMLSSLEPWTTYEVKISAFTTQVPNGFGPASDPVKVKTPETFAGPVADVLVVSPSSLAILISWKPPQKPNGIINGYVVAYAGYNESTTYILQQLYSYPSWLLQNVTDMTKTHPYHQQDTAENFGKTESSAVHLPLIPSSFSFSHPPASRAKREVHYLKTDSTSILLHDLEPGRLYAVTVAAVNSAGVGSPTSKSGIVVKQPAPTLPTFTTLAMIATSMEVKPEIDSVDVSSMLNNTTDVTYISRENSTLAVLTSVAKLPVGIYPILIGGGLSVLILLISLIMVCCWKCRYLPSERAVPQRKYDYGHTNWGSGIIDTMDKDKSHTTDVKRLSGPSSAYTLPPPLSKESQLQRFLELTRSPDLAQRNVGTQTAPKQKSSIPHAAEKEFHTIEPENENDRADWAALVQQNKVDRVEPLYDVSDASPPMLRRVHGARIKNISAPKHIGMTGHAQKQGGTIPWSYIESSDSEVGNAEAEIKERPLSMLHTSRMMGPSADAIAVKRIKASTPEDFPTQDTESLITNDAVVVFDERTAL